MIFSGIIWNAAYQYSYAILSDIQHSYDIITFCHYNLGKQYPEFVRDIYKFDTIPEHRITAKIEAMSKFSSKNIVFFEINIHNPTKEYVPRKRRFTFIQAEHLKESIRTKYSKIVSPYIFDIILHMTEDDEERAAVQQCLKKYEMFQYSQRGK